ncbi:Ecl1p KNAG_0C03030 [Huiozyma naganishii CBS 8797]|uniref:Uncharacterized protein n=1 Tax=Huiozyma naganishii (strain ATCC MYA-139 / BCRC 22969 / CBS 8797 / KCTC 17520 / NBRC 10181 / NCYC 3082 / Yp74L-3) TaxID=1071383 RepID=J7S4Q5_HUIN7|nr:hypothetical protein KNAG_0C03030 [Kazachstania naganishii CBS 8797]CCK69414.1 hypothetical protein KNAG_0C03030 [Kazachstania naganishii CBS 8797]
MESFNDFCSYCDQLIVNPQSSQQLSHLPQHLYSDKRAREDHSLFCSEHCKLLDQQSFQKYHHTVNKDAIQRANERDITSHCARDIDNIDTLLKSPLLHPTDSQKRERSKVQGDNYTMGEWLLDSCDCNIRSSVMCPRAFGKGAPCNL